MKKATTLALSLMTVIALLLTGCSSSTGSSQTQESAASTETAASTATDSSSDIDLSGVTLRVNGFNTTQALLDAAGLSDTPYTLEIDVYAGGNLALQAMAADELDLAYTSEIPPLFASLAEGGGNFKIVATGEGNTQLQDLIVGPESTVQSVAELKGQKVGYVQSTTAQYFLLKMLDQAGLTWDDIEPVNLSPSDGLAALISGDIAAFAVYGPQVTTDLAQGGRILESAEDILSGNYIYSASELALADPATSAAIVDYLSRTEQANEWIRNHYEEYAKIAAESNGMTEEDYVAYLKTGDAQRESHIRAFTESDQASLQDVADSFYGVGLLESQIDVQTLYSDTLADQIAQQVKTN
ncbi:MAG: nitrate transporter substrate-binding protein [Oscillospiraceae bacterium]|nr:nitrate transporter substrate-binding protein [Oscillospiraceae bacterium]